MSRQRAWRDPWAPHGGRVPVGIIPAGARPAGHTPAATSERGSKPEEDALERLRQTTVPAITAAFGAGAMIGAMVGASLARRGRPRHNQAPASGQRL